MKTFAFLLSVFVLATASAVTVTVNRAQQRFPWNGLVDVDFALSGTTDDTGYRLDLALVDGVHEYVATTFRTEPVVIGDGAHRVTWDFGKDHPEVALTNVTVKLDVAPLGDTDPLYLVFDLSEGSTAANYPHRYTTKAPDPSDDVCRTIELWMRRVPGGTFTRGNTIDNEGGRNSLPPHKAKVSKPYYLGVFEMTQRQYYQLTGTWPSYFTADRELRPVETVSFIDFRGDHKDWYSAGNIPSTSPLYKLRQATGFLRFDLPTESQWEHAYRAGTVCKFWSEELTDDNVALLSRNANQKAQSSVKSGDVLPDDGGTQKVGSFPPNKWGFYDMAGNVQEICGDGNPYTTNTTLPETTDYAAEPYVDIRGPTQEWATRTKATTTEYTSSCTTRGGSWQHSYNGGTAYWRDGVGRGGGRNNTIGFRLCITCD